MNRRLLICSIVVALTVGSRASQGQNQNPNHVCPQWLWGSTGNIHHYYSQYCHKNVATSPPCTDLGWDNYDDLADDLAQSSKSCSSCDCINFTFKDRSQTEPASQTNQRGNESPQLPGDRPKKKSIGDIKLPQKKNKDEFPDKKNTDKIKTDYVYDIIVAAKIPPNAKPIKVKLYLARLEPKDKSVPSGPPIVVANGFEVEDTTTPFSVPDNAVEQVEDHIYDITLGSITYRVIINTDP